jgi:sortase (surface protein transpeptidase)
MAISSFTQSAVDKYDIVYTTEAMDSNNPFILGHNHGTMQYISKINKGDLIYVSVNGNVRTYKVVVSEFAMQNNSHTDIIGQSSGYSIWDNLGGETLHMYTCYGVNNGRWMVLAIRV